MTLRRAARSRPLFAAVGVCVRASGLVLGLTFGLAGCSGGADDPFNFGPVFSSPAGPQERGVWEKRGAGPQARSAAISTCREIARAQIDRDRRIDRDRQVGSATTGIDRPGAGLNRQLRDYSQENRRRRLFQNCMQDKGWRLD